MTFAEKIKKLRLESGMTQEDLAQKVFVSRVAVSKWETGRGCPNLDSLQLIAGTFGVSVDNLLSAADYSTGQAGKAKASKAKAAGLFNTFAFMLLLLPVFRTRAVDGSFAPVLIFNVFYSSRFVLSVSLLVIVMTVFAGLASICSVQMSFKSRILVCIVSNSLMLFVFVLTLQPYPAVFSAVLLLLNFASGFLRN